MLYQTADWVWKRLFIGFCRHKYHTVWFGKTGGVTLNSDYRYAPEYGRIEGFVANLVRDTGAAEFCAQLCCECLKLLEGREVVLFELIFSDHVSDFDALEGR